MTQPEQEPQQLKFYQIRRNQIYIGLAISATIALIITRCSVDEANESIEVVFYKNTAQCEADINRQQAEYAALEQQYQAGTLAEKPDPPPLQAKDCAPQMLAAEQEHHQTAPVYASLADCQAEGVQCEATPPSEQIAGYRPVYGGTYIDPYDSSGYIYVYHGGTPHRVYTNHTVYQSVTSGNIVTPYGREISQPTTGMVSAPRHTTYTAPSRPSGTTAAGTIRGRSSQGFGSSFKSSGRGGK